MDVFAGVGKSALHWAAAVNNVEATLVLLKNGANRDMQDNKVLLNAIVVCLQNPVSCPGVQVSVRCCGVWSENYFLSLS